MIPVDSGAWHDEIIGEGLATFDRRLGDGCAVHGVGALDAVPVDGRVEFGGKVVGQVHDDPVAHHGSNLGTGNLAPYIIRAQASVRGLKRVLVWGRTPANAQKIVEQMSGERTDLEISVASDLQAACGEADIVVSATASHEPLVLGDWIRPGTHTDFIGNHHPTKRECDTALVVKSKIYADSRTNCFKEAGEVLVPISEGVIEKKDVVGELTEMCAGTVPLRTNDQEITLFKSIGMALCDLIGAGLAYRVANT